MRETYSHIIWSNECVAHYLIKINDKFLEWSTDTAAPTTSGMTLSELSTFIDKEYGADSLKGVPRLLMLDGLQGTAESDALSVEKLIQGNRAGDDGIELTLDEIYQKYCRSPHRHVDGPMERRR